MNDLLKKKVDMAVKLIQSAGKMADSHGQPLEIAYSGGKDSDVILELAKMSGVNYKAIYKNTTIDPAGTIKHAREMGAEVLHPTMTFKQIIETKGFPSRWRRFCCETLKEYKVLDYVVIGIRREESRARKERYKEPEVCKVYNKKKNIKVRQYLPILDWTADDVSCFVQERGIKCHPLYYDDEGKFHAERRLGCLCCPLISKGKRIDEFKKYPKMVHYYISSAQKFLLNHPKSRISKTFPTVFDWFTSYIFSNGIRDFNERFGATEIFGNDAIDTKAYLEKQFNIKL